MFIHFPGRGLGQLSGISLVAEQLSANLCFPVIPAHPHGLRDFLSLGGTALEHGKHLLADFWGVPESLLNDMDRLRDILYTAAKAGNCTVVSEKFHRFSPVGVTGVLVLAESHLSIHTWPEDGYCAIDAFTCGDSTNMPAILNSLLDSLEPSVHQASLRLRGGPRPLPGSQRV